MNVVVTVVVSKSTVARGQMGFVSVATETGMVGWVGSVMVASVEGLIGVVGLVATIPDAEAAWELGWE